MIKTVRDKSLEGDPRHVGILEVKYPGEDKWDIEGFCKYRDETLVKIKEEGASYSRDEVFRGTPYFRYFRKFGQTYPVMRELESLLLKGRPFKEERYINAVAFLTELKTHALLGTHDADRIEGDLIFYNESEKTYYPGMIRDDTHSYPGDITGRDDKDIVISMVSGADSRTCLHDDSTHVIYLVFGVPEMSNEEITSVAEELKKTALTLAPDAETEFTIV